MEHAAARRAGMSNAAPYRYFTDREALLPAVAAIGYRELAADLTAAHPETNTAEGFVEIAVAYVRFALDRPELFRAMLIETCDPNTPEHVAAVAAIQAYLGSIVRRAFSDADPDAMATAVWGFRPWFGVSASRGRVRRLVRQERRRPGPRCAARVSGGPAPVWRESAGRGSGGSRAVSAAGGELGQIGRFALHAVSRVFMPSLAGTRRTVDWAMTAP